MKNNFNILRTTRTNILNSIKDLTIDQLNKIPPGFGNNIIWNVAHIIVTQQLLVYKLSGVEPKISDEMIEKYKKGTMADSNVSESEIESIKGLLLSTVDWIEEDYSNEIFKSFNEYPTSYNIVLNSTEDAILFNNVHEGLHFGYIMAMKKVVY